MDQGIVIAVIGVFGSILGSWAGVRIAVAEVKKDVEWLKKIVEKHDDKLA